VGIFETKNIGFSLDRILCILLLSLFKYSIDSMSTDKKIIMVNIKEAEL